MTKLSDGAARVVDVVTFARGRLVRGGVRRAVPMESLEPALLRELEHLPLGAVARVELGLAKDHPDPGLRAAPAVLLVRVRRADVGTASPFEVPTLSPEDARAVDALAQRLGVTITPADVDAEMQARWQRLEEPALKELKLDEGLQRDALALWLSDGAMRDETEARLRRSLALLQSAPKVLRAEQVEPFLAELARTAAVSVPELKATLKGDRALAAAAERIVLERAALAALRATTGPASRR
ncbi:MAG: hypothetical protein IT383_15385 [Deltaproteobacteria bacterium]|jgi:hypothetical protein|nr:hypothetical protein [Deltaproteobacteria bacterium]